MIFPASVLTNESKEFDLQFKFGQSVIQPHASIVQLNFNAGPDSNAGKSPENFTVHISVQNHFQCAVYKLGNRYLS